MLLKTVVRHSLCAYSKPSLLPMSLLHELILENIAELIQTTQCGWPTTESEMLVGVYCVSSSRPSRCFKPACVTVSYHTRVIERGEGGSGRVRRMALVNNR